MARDEQSGTSPGFIGSIECFSGIKGRMHKKLHLVAERGSISEIIPARLFNFMETVIPGMNGHNRGV